MDKDGISPHTQRTSGEGGTAQQGGWLLGQQNMDDASGSSSSSSDVSYAEEDAPVPTDSSDKEDEQVADEAEADENSMPKDNDEKKMEGEEAVEFEEAEEAPIRVTRNPADPTPEERARHNTTHLPHRPWCSICVEARAREDPHYRQTAKEQHRVEGALHLLLVEGNDRAAYLYDLTRPSRCQDHADGCLVDYLVSPWWDQFDDCRVRVDGDVSAAAVLDQGGHYEEADSECQERDDHDGAAAVHGGRLPGGRSLRSDRRVGSFGPRGCSAGRVLRSSLAP